MIYFRFFAAFVLKHVQQVRLDLDEGLDGVRRKGHGWNCITGIPQGLFGLRLRTQQVSKRFTPRAWNASIRIVVYLSTQTAFSCWTSAKA